jgi:hypothetical protein
MGAGHDELVNVLNARRRERQELLQQAFKITASVVGSLASSQSAATAQ